MKTIKILAIILVLAVSLTACNRNRLTPNNTLQTQPTTEPNPPTVHEPEFYIELHGIKLDLAKADVIKNGEGEEIDAKQAYESGEYFNFEFKDVTIGRKSTGVSYHSAKHENYYDPAEMKLRDEYPEPHEVRELKLEDMFGGLKVTQASLSGQKTGTDVEIATSVKYEGEIKLKGWLVLAIEDEGHEKKGDILFFVDASSTAGLPFPVKAAKDHGMFYVLSDDSVYYSDIAMFRLGSIHDEEYDADFTAIPEDGSVIEAEVTLSELNLRASDQQGFWYEAVITGIE
ncbi:MAG: hypothetical protein FWD34_00560 [Oscillospiraceae bacterium]|nr:hypothetical protein [Oscillospiraceae bacterium]